jgi:cation:H+ antiporter
MIDTIFWVVVFVLSLAILIKASDYFTDAALKIGIFFRIPAFIIGVTIVAVGTSVPELGFSIIAVMKNSSEIVVANVIGSNITNIFFVLGVASIVSKKIRISYKISNIVLVLFMGSSFFLAITVYDGFFTFPEALLCVSGLILYIFYSAKTQSNESIKEVGKKSKTIKGIWKPLVIFIASMFFIFISAEYTVESILKLSEIFGIGKEIIAVSAVALGTSLPEFAVFINATRKGIPEIAVGNVLGSNIFNTFAVMGIPALFGTLIIPQTIILFALPMMLIAAFMYFFVMLGQEITKWEGWMLLIFYIFFIGRSSNIF